MTKIGLGLDNTGPRMDIWKKTIVIKVAETLESGSDIMGINHGLYCRLKVHVLIQNRCNFKTSTDSKWTNKQILAI